MKNKISLFLILCLMASGCSNGSSGSVPNTAVPAGGAFNKVTSGTAHTCVLTTSSQIKCWGSNIYGQLGDGTTVDKLSPTLIDAATTYTEISAGDGHTCAITTGGVLKCWGHNSSGQLGNGTTLDQVTAITIDLGTSYSQVSTSGNVTCGITIANVLKCWGYNGQGGVGDGTVIDKTSPIVINGGTTYSKIATGALHTCGITSAGVLKCWGNNDSGQLGDSTTANKNLPVIIDGGVTYSKIAVSSFIQYHTCGVTTANVLKCWGNNIYGQVGDGSTTTRPAPTIIAAGTSFSDVSVGYVHTCAIVLTTGLLKCWGYNFYYQLGDYTSSTRLSPVQADTGFTYAKISASNNYTCGLTTNSNMRTIHNGWSCCCFCRT